MTFKGTSTTTTQACAACRYQHKRCTPECALAPHFHPEDPVIFRNAHKLFGVRNILRTLEQINPHHKTEAMQSIIYEANMRDRFPVHGCLTLVCDLQHQIRKAEEKLFSVLTRLAFYKQQHERQVRSLGASFDLLQHGISILQPNNPLNTNFQNNATFPLPFLSYENTNMCNYAFWLQDTYNTRNDIHKHLVSQPLLNKEVVHDHDEVDPLFYNIEDQQTYANMKDDESRY